MEDIEQGRAREIIIARNGRPAARLVPVGDATPADKRLGVTKGLFAVHDNIDKHNDAVAQLFSGGAPI